MTGVKEALQQLTIPVLHNVEFDGAKLRVPNAMHSALALDGAKIEYHKSGGSYITVDPTQKQFFSKLIAALAAREIARAKKDPKQALGNVQIAEIKKRVAGKVWGNLPENLQSLGSN